MPKLIFWRHFVMFAFSLFCFSCFRRVRETAPLRSKGAKGGRRQEKHPERSQGGCHSREGSRASPKRQVANKQHHLRFPRSDTDPASVRPGQSTRLVNKRPATTCDWPPMSLPHKASTSLTRPTAVARELSFAQVELPQCNAAPPCTQDGIRYRM